MTELNIALPPRDPKPLARILRAIGNELRSPEMAFAAEAPEEDYPGYREQMALVAEGFLGAAFVSGQTYINGVISMAGILQDLSADSKRIQKHELLRMHNPMLAGTRYSRVQIIDALANYFKHRDEWGSEWVERDVRAQKIVQIMTSVGASPQADDNIVRGAKALGFGDYESLETMAFELADWGYDVLQTLRFRVNAAHREYA